MTTDTEDDLWSWVDSEPEPLGPVPTGDTVTAVMVVRNGAEWLRDALASLSRLAVAPGRLVVVDNGSTDGSAGLLESAAAAGRLRLVAGDARWGFAQSVRAALDAAGEPTEWVWLLHDDVVVHPQALTRLLEQTARTPDADIVGPLLVTPTRRTRAALIAELGVTISHTGRRELGLEPGEIAQGQHEPADTLGVSTCGMLIRRSAYERLGGLAQALPLHRDGVELGWRATAAGMRVVTCPAARITHRQAGRRGHRHDTVVEAAGRNVRAYDRLMGMRAVAGHARGAAVPFVWLRLVVGCLLRALGFLLGKRPDLSRDELRALGDFVRSGDAVRGLRRQVAASGPQPAGLKRVQQLRPHVWSSWLFGLDHVARAVSERLQAFTAGGVDDDLTLDELTGDDFAEHASRGRRSVLPLLGVSALVVAVLLASRRLLGIGWLTSSGLLPAPADLGAAFAAYLSAPPGHYGEHPLWLGLTALVAVPFVSPDWAAVGALLLGVPAATVACAWFLEPYVLGLRSRWLTSVLYALLPVLVAGYSRGQVWLVAWTVALPVLALSLRTWGRRRGLEEWRSAAGVAIALTVMGAVIPLGLVVGAVVTLGVALRRRAGFVRAWIAVLGAVLMAGPWLLGLVWYPGRILTGPEPLLAAGDATAVWELFVGRSAGPGLPPLWLSLVAAGLVWLGAAVALALRPSWWGVWAGAVACLVLAAVLSRLVVQVAGGHVRPEVTMWLVAGFGLLIVGSAAAVDRARLDLEDADFGLGQALVVGSGVLGALALLVTSIWWVWGGVGAPLGRTDALPVPVYVRDAENTLRSRAFVVTMHDGGPSWYVDRPGHPSWGDGETGYASEKGTEAARTVAAQVASGRQIDGLAASLADLGVSHLVVNGATPEAAAALGATPGLQRGAVEGSNVLVWLVTDKPSWVQVREGTSVSYATTEVPPGGPDRTLVLAEPPDVRWVVTVGGQELAPAVSPDWRAAYHLGEASGAIEVRLVDGAPWWAWLQLAGLALMLLFAAPSLQRDDDEVPIARRASSRGVTS